MFANVLKFILGFLLAIGILAGGSFVAALYVMNRASIPPAKPTFANDNPSVKGEAPKSAVAEGKATSKSKANVASNSTPTPSASPKTVESPKPLPPGAYPARVTWSQGLVLRSEPQMDAERLGGVGFRQKIIVLEQSQDKIWQKIRLEGTNQEGWVKAGNTKPVDKNDSQSPQPAEEQ
ncbi:MAG: SH3 domain-containing protein [Stigonema ocellatum SAG 48.90 = DSM 106950]|nr:SH3 domain-containing protein [Stigonema ocellatum SAG 48.90 = DSM 106950]